MTFTLSRSQLVVGMVALVAVIATISFAVASLTAPQLAGAAQARAAKASLGSVQSEIHKLRIDNARICRIEATKSYSCPSVY